MRTKGLAVTISRAAYEQGQEDWRRLLALMEATRPKPMRQQIAEQLGLDPRDSKRDEFFWIGLEAHGSLPLPLRACRVPMTNQPSNDSKD